MLVYLARHGQTSANRRRAFHGRVESTLTRKGLAQSRQIASRLKGRGIARVYCSSLKRAVQTGGIVAEGLGVPLDVSADLMELDFGTLDTVLMDDAWRKHPRMMERRSRDKFNFVAPGGESYAMAQKRASKLLKKILKRRREKAVAIVAHECINRTIIGFLLKKDATWMMGMIHPHKYIYLIDTKKKTVSNTSIKDGSKKQGTISAT